MGENKVMDLIIRARNKVREINLRYRTPKIQVSRGVKLSLLLLRLYLLFLVVILIYKFITTING